MYVILIVDDDLKLLKMLQRTLSYESYTVITATNGQEALRMVESQKPDLIILDWMMPRMDGLTVVQRLRGQDDQTMILMLTAKDAIENRIEGLESGADDYLIKPFAPGELVARVHSLLRRLDKKVENQKIQYSFVALDPISHEVTVEDHAINLTLTEYNLLHQFILHPRHVMERRQLLNDVWGYEFNGDDNVLEIYVGYLRKKLEAFGHPRLIQTIRGVGYVMREEE